MTEQTVFVVLQKEGTNLGTEGLHLGGKGVNMIKMHYTREFSILLI